MWFGVFLVWVSTDFLWPDTGAATAALVVFGLCTLPILVWFVLGRLGALLALPILGWALVHSIVTYIGASWGYGVQRLDIPSPKARPED